MANDAGVYRGTNVSRGRIVPLISTYVSGPLGVPHLPRLWLKALLHARNVLAEDWGCGPGGLDRRLTTFLGIDGTALLSWLMETLPSYEETEAWVRVNATNLNPQSIAQAVEAFATLPLPPGLNEQFRAYLGISDDTVNVGVTLNNYDDWQALYAYVGRYADDLEPIVPAISPTTAGLLGIPNLPRLWLKATLAAAGALPDGYSLAVEPRDEVMLGALRLANEDVRNYVAERRPTYGEFETYVASRARAPVGKVPWDDLLERHGEGTQATHRYDWGLLHAQIRALPAPPTDRSNQQRGLYAFEASGLRAFRPRSG
jgi:hypothetical protein